MNYAILILFSLLSFRVLAVEITDTKAPKNLEIYCGDNESGTLRLVINGTNASLYLNNASTMAEIETITEEAGGNYHITLPSDHLIRISKDSLQATIYRVYFPPYTELPIKRINCTWTRK